MAGPDMASITSSLERSFQNCSLNNNHHHHHHQQTTSSSGSTAAGDGVGEASQGEDSAENGNSTLELNSEASLPYHWEQCLDLKTGEIYYINWRTGMKSEEDPRTTGDYYYSDDDESSSCESEGSSSESSPSSSSRQPWSGSSNAVQENGNCPVQKNDGQNDGYTHRNNDDYADNNSDNSGSVLVVAGCKSCLMYYMVPKQLEICPKCCGQLLYFDRSENGSS